MASKSAFGVGVIICLCLAWTQALTATVEKPWLERKPLKESTVSEFDCKMDDAKAGRTKAKRALTKEMNYVRQCIAENKLDSLEDQRHALNVLFRKFSEIHDIYHETLKDDTDIDESDDYFHKEQNNYINALEKIQTNLEDGNLSLNVENKPVTDLPGNLIAFLNLPRVELEYFDGDTLHYHQFIKSFELNVDHVCTDSNIKLTRLVQYTRGPAKDAIRGCLLIGGETGYKQALHILKERFGNPHLVAEKIIADLRKRKPVRSPIDMQQLADDLKNAELVLNQLKMISEVSSQSTIIDIVSRLQSYIQIMWKNRALDVKRTKGHYPTFADLVQFIADRASEMNDPVYGASLFRKETSNKSNPQSQFSTSHATFAKSDDTSISSYRTHSNAGYAKSEPMCILCSEYHRLWHCQLFKRMPPIKRAELVRQHKLCENCLLPTHNVQSCGKKSVCSVQGCGKKHTMYIHIDENQSTSMAQGTSVSNASVSSDKEIYMPVVQVLVNNEIKANALLDTGSSNSFCSNRLAKQLNLRGQTVSYHLNTLSKSAPAKSKMVNLSLSSVNGEIINLSGVYIIDKIPVKSAPLDVKAYKHLMDIDLVSCESVNEVDLLIGQDHTEALIPLEVRKGNKGEPFAIRTILGWCVNGQSPISRVSHSVVSNFVTAASVSISDDIHTLWRIENEGLDEVGWSLEDKSVIDLWNKECTKVDGHYEIPIPWKDREEPLPNNYSLANGRLESTTKKLHRQGLFEKYNSEINKLVSEGYAEVVPSKDIYTAERIWYLPHHAIITQKKPDKLRVVFDCAAQFKGKSLNDRCKQGPNLMNKLLNILLRFRQHRYAIQADIEAMYHQVKIPLKDRNALRFLWFDKDQKVISYRMTSHLFGGIWCSSSSAYALIRTITENGDHFAEILAFIEKSFYVDDFLKSLCSRYEVNVVLEQLPLLLSEGGFNLTKFVVNDSMLLQKVPECHRANEVKYICSEASGKALGVKWNIMVDELVFEVSVKVEHLVTRRKMLSLISSMYDPLGLVGPHILLGKLLFQDATRHKYDWDQEISVKLSEQWFRWVGSLDLLNHLQVSRCIKPSEFDDAVIELHHFSDASQSAYGSCCYIRCVNKDGKIHAQLIMSKNKVSPIKQCSIPRLELQAALLSAKVDALLRKEFDFRVDQSYFWVDSKIVLAYIVNNTRRFQIFVENRVGMIRQLTNPEQWFHIAGQENPADIISRGHILDHQTCELWFKGPHFLGQYKSEWIMSNASSSVPLSMLEIKKEPVRVCHVTNTDSDWTSDSRNPIYKIANYFSDWFRMKRALAWWIRLADICRHRVVKPQYLDIDHIQRAESCLIKFAQGSHYKHEIERLLEQKEIKKSSPLRSLCPYLDTQGLLRVGGRFEFFSKHPVIVPVNHVVAKAIIYDYHNAAHLGTEWTLSLIRQKFWIIRARPMIKKIIKSCITCRRMFAKPSCQIMADLPQERIDSDKPPFTYVGVDVFGPFLVKVNRAEVKRYGCMFTCLTSRAVHIEMLYSLETESFINGLRRFISRRGNPDKMYSDNGTNFVGANAELKRALKELSRGEIEGYALRSDIEWHFNPPYASHMGGAWERMIGCARRVIEGILHKPVRLTDEILVTLFTEVESIVNGRPLTKLSDDQNDPTPLTPNHLLLLKAGCIMPPGKFDKSDQFRRRWRHVQHLANQFWNKWVKLYLPELQKRVKWTTVCRNLSVGDLVLLSDENLPRNMWPLGIVKVLSRGRDGNVRSVRVKTKATELVRPITKVILLEAATYKI